MKQTQSVIYLTIVVFLSILIVSCSSTTIKKTDKTTEPKFEFKYKDTNFNNIPDFLESTDLTDEERIKKMKEFLENKQKDKHYNAVNLYRNDLAEKIRLKAKKGLLGEEFKYKITNKNLNLFKEAKIYEMENDLSIYKLAISKTSTSAIPVIIEEKPKITINELYENIILPTLEQNKNRLLEENEFLNLFKKKINNINAFKFYFIDTDLTPRKTVIPFELANLQLGPARIQVENYNRLIRKKVDDELKRLSILKNSLTEKYRLYNNKILIPLTSSYLELLEKARQLANVDKTIQDKKDEIQGLKRREKNTGKKIKTKTIYWGLIEYEKNQSKNDASNSLENLMKQAAKKYYAKWNTQVSKRILNDKFVEDTIYREQSAKVTNVNDSTYSLDQYNYKTDKPVYSSILNLEINFDPSYRGTVSQNFSNLAKTNQSRKQSLQTVRLTTTNVDSYNIPDPIKEKLKRIIRENTILNQKAIKEAKREQIKTKKKRRVIQQELAKLIAIKTNFENNIQKDLREIIKKKPLINKQCKNLYFGYNNTQNKENSLKNKEGKFVFRFINSRQSQLSKNSNLSLETIKNQLKNEIREDFKYEDIGFYLNEEVFEGDEEIYTSNKKLEVQGTIKNDDINEIFVMQKTTDLQNNRNIHNIYGLAVLIKANINVTFNIEDINVYNEQEASKVINDIRQNHTNYLEKQNATQSGFINYCFNKSHESSALGIKEIDLTNDKIDFNKEVKLEHFLKKIKTQTVIPIKNY